ncbi:MAG TPA: MaoC family dehydratase [Phenylobacterium sp.]|uniref:MaoC family dehydratase n=1 Tax=Phenylobacterium sp. TaxID=1871053 RepID=UPI002C6D8014|nr:MaoC family dehydratase [Phenylobacterium sp.]HSV03353.1 MaoC family dehydratase [Phenylobacterium sp.]
MKLSELTGSANYFEDFEVGQVIKHARGKTIEGLENVLITNLVMNTAQAHFNEDAMKASPYGGRLSYGGVNFSVAMGLAMQDCGENALAELSMDNIRLLHPVVHGDTLYAYSEVLETQDAERDDAGVVTFRHYGVNQDDKLVFQGERTMLIKRRSHWGER